MNRAKRAKLSRKERLQKLYLGYTSLSWQDQVSQTRENKVTAKGVLNKLCPPRYLEALVIEGYFGNFLPKWLNLGSALPNLRYLKINNCNCFKKLVSLGQLPNLEYLRIKDAYSVVSIREEFFGTNTGSRGSHTVIPLFPKLNKLILEGMPNWNEWEWNMEKPAMPKLKILSIKACPQLRSLPEGLMHHATSLEVLTVKSADNLITVENFQSIKKITLVNNLNIERISNLPSVSRVLIKGCPNLNAVDNLNNSLQSLILADLEMEFLPWYVMTAMPQKLTIYCSEDLLRNITSQGGSEWRKFEHIPKVKIYSPDKSLYGMYQRTPLRSTSNIY